VAGRAGQEVGERVQAERFADLTPALGELAAAVPVPGNEPVGEPRRVLVAEPQIAQVRAASSRR
jgi:hypothetical protein